MTFFEAALSDYTKIKKPGAHDFILERCRYNGIYMMAVICLLIPFEKFLSTFCRIISVANFNGCSLRSVKMKLFGWPRPFILSASFVRFHLYCSLVRVAMRGLTSKWIVNALKLKIRVSSKFQRLQNECIAIGKYVTPTRKFCAFMKYLEDSNY